jgi:hypothetical protein
MVAAPVVRDFSKTRSKGCFYCGRMGHLQVNCRDKKRGIKPCQEHLDWAKKVYGEDYKWDHKKGKSVVKPKEAVTVIEGVKEESDTEEVAVVAANPGKGKFNNRSVGHLSGRL